MYAQIAVVGLKKDLLDPKAYLGKYPPRKDKVLKPVIENKFLQKNLNIPPRQR